MKKLFLSLAFSAALMFSVSVGYASKEQITQTAPELHAHTSNAP